MEKYKVIIFGCGVMGRKTAQALLDKKSFEIVGAVDIDPELFGKDLGEIFDPPKTLGILIERKPDVLLSSVKADAVVLTTTSHLESVAPQIIQCLEAGLNVVSTCEELSFPWKRHPELTQKLDNLAKEQGVTVVGTGINPGFLMDLLPLVLTAPCLKIQSVKVKRMMNSAKRREPFQVKVGTGLTLEEFKKKIENKIITGHVGLLESINMIASGLGWELDEAVELPPEPVIDEKEITTALGEVQPGDVIGLRSVAFGKKGGKEVITLEFCANAAVEEEYDEIIIEGEPKIHQKIIGGVHGDIGTVAVTVNTIPRAVEAPPGIVVMKDLPPPNAVQ
ncbi:MAG: Gfo/Idh/MocA family oxidoreductase [Candidatus Aminicenantes bacterium]|nr:MAG: Gfo/Idh/MocA family oxidoreductase [Candidatus Aminicenantes bacterium]